jgi:transcriptional regulator with XRE-family HTH domain
MKGTLDYLNEAKARLGLESDYALAKHLGLTVGTVSHYVNRRRVIDPYTAAKLAEILEIDAIEIIAAAEFEREKDEQRKSFWKRFVQRL